MKPGGEGGSGEANVDKREGGEEEKGEREGEEERKEEPAAVMETDTVERAIDVKEGEGVFV